MGTWLAFWIELLWGGEMGRLVPAPKGTWETWDLFEGWDMPDPWRFDEKLPWIHDG